MNGQIGNETRHSGRISFVLRVAKRAAQGVWSWACCSSQSNARRGLAQSRGIESANSYLLLVSWDSVEAHQVGFRGSPQYQEWKRMLHHFYDPFPVVEHHSQVPNA